VVVVRSDMKRYDPVYTLTVEGAARTRTAMAKRSAHTATLARPVTAWVAWDGHLVTSTIQQDLATLWAKARVYSLEK
jgi:hypothetical protein